MDIQQIVENPEIVQSIAQQLGMTPEELIQQVQQNPQIAQQILEMLGGQPGTAGTDDANWMDQAAQQQAGPEAEAEVAEEPES